MAWSKLAKLFALSVAETAAAAEQVEAASQSVEWDQPVPAGGGGTERVTSPPVDHWVGGAEAEAAVVGMGDGGGGTG